MSVAVELADLRDAVEEHGPVAFLVTVGADGRPHVVSAGVAMTGDTIVAGCGRTTAANAQRSSSISLLWPALPGASYCLIVDGTATVDATGPQVVVEPVRAVLHRVADAPDDGPTCVRIVDQRQERTGG